MGRLPRILGAAMGTAARRPVAVGLLVTVLALAGAALALRLAPTTASQTLVGTSRYGERSPHRTLPNWSRTGCPFSTRMSWPGGAGIRARDHRSMFWSAASTKMRFGNRLRGHWSQLIGGTG